MADHITVVVSGGATRILQTTDNTSYHTPAHQLVNAAGTSTLGVFAEDAAHSSAHTGLMALGVRSDTAAATGGTDGDYMPLIFDSAGKLHVNVGAFTPGTAAGSLGKAEDAAHTTGDTGVMMLGVRNDTHTGALAGTDADYTPFGVDSTGKIGIRGTFAEDAAHTSADLGIQILTVRQDTAAALSGTDADYQPLITDASGRLWVNAGAMGTVTPGTAATSLGKAEDAAHTTGDVGVFALAVRSDTAAATGGTDGDYVALITDSAGKLHVNVGAVAPGTAASSLGKAEDAVHSSGDVGVFALAVANTTHTTTFGADGDYCPIAVDTTGKIGIRGTFAEDVASTTGDLGIFTLAVRNDADAALSGTDLDYTAQAVDSAGRVKANIVEERVILDVTPVCDTSAYTAADVLFDRITCGTVARVTGGTVVLESVIVLDEDDQTAAEMDLYFLDTDVTLGTANAAVSITDANARKIVGHVNIPAAAFKDFIGSRCAFVRGINMSMKCAAGSQILYVAGVTAGTPTQTADGIKLKLAFRRG